MDRQAVPASVDLIAPHGGELKQLYVSEAERAILTKQACEMPSWALTPRQLCDLEMLLNGSFSPLAGFMSQDDCDAVLQRMRLADGRLWPTPITLDVTATFAASLSRGQRVALRDPEGVLIAVLEVTDIWSSPDSVRDQRMPVSLGGPVFGIDVTVHYDFRSLRETPRQVRERLAGWGRPRVAAYQTQHIMHRSHVEATQRLAHDLDASLLIQPLLNTNGHGTSEYFSRIRCHEMVMRHYPVRAAVLNLLPLAQQRFQERELILRAIIARNFGCSHLVMDAAQGREGGDTTLLKSVGEELAVEVVECHTERVRGESGASPSVRPGAEEPLSADEIEGRIRAGQVIPDWYTYPEVLDELRHMYPPRHERGFVIFFTGLSGAGKSTLANAVRCKLLECGRRQITLLDGDHVRKHLSSELGFSKEHRDLNVLRIGFVASEIARHGGIAICAPIAPYADIRRQVRRMVEEVGGFVEIHVSTSLEVCERRDRKGLYAKARAGLLKSFTGIDDPYEPPIAPEVIIDTASCSPDDATHRVIQKLAELGYIRPWRVPPAGQPNWSAAPHMAQAQ